MGMVAAGHALCVPGNHENKLVRALRAGRVGVRGLASAVPRVPAALRARRVLPTTVMTGVRELQG